MFYLDGINEVSFLRVLMIVFVNGDNCEVD